MTCGELIKSKRKEFALNQQRLSDLIGVSQGTISKYESDTIIPSLIEAGLLSEVLSITIKTIYLAALKTRKKYRK